MFTKVKWAIVYKTSTSGNDVFLELILLYFYLSNILNTGL